MIALNKVEADIEKFYIVSYKSKSTSNTIHGLAYTIIYQYISVQILQTYSINKNTIIVNIYFQLSYFINFV